MKFKHSIFKRVVPIEMLQSFIAHNCEKDSLGYYVFNKNSFKRSMINKTIETFVRDLIPYYHISKQKYVDKKHNYRSITTIVRQICKLHKLKYTSNIKYLNSTYEIVYVILLENDIPPVKLIDINENVCIENQDKVDEN